MPSFQPKYRRSLDRIAILEEQCKNLLIAVEYLETVNDDLRLRVKWLEEHAMTSQMKRGDS